MRPGEDCLSCHGGEGARHWYVAGTVYADPQAGADAGIMGVDVLVQDSVGAAFTLRSNGAGNFYTAETLQPPLTVAVQKDGVRIDMESPINDGDCNSCHGVPARGDAPGRIYLPQ